MNTLSLKLTKEDINKILLEFKDYIEKDPAEYIAYRYKGEDLQINIYYSQKAVFTGALAHEFVAKLLKKDERMAGSDEVGTGDYFGPVCVCATIVEKEDFTWLYELGVTDSKKLDDQKVLEIAPHLIKKLKHSLLILDNKTYNEIHKQNNLNMIKAKMHNKAYINLLHKGYDVPKIAMIDEFCAPHLYFNYLKDEKEVYRLVQFETKAEDRYLAVAASSVIARYAFLKSLAKMSQTYQIEFEKGAGEAVDKCAQNFIQKHGIKALNEVAKLHFKNTEKIS